MMSKVLTPMLVLIVAVLAVALFLRGSEVMFAISSVNSTYATLNLSDVAPSVNASCWDKASGSSTTVTLVGGSKREVVCNGTADDPNGNTELTSVDGVFGQTVTPNTAWCADSVLNCYVNSSCAFLGTINATAKYYECKFFISFNAQNTSQLDTTGWGYNITLTSNGVNRSASSSNVLNVSEVLAIGVPGSLTFSNGRQVVAGINDSLVGNPACKECMFNISNFGNVLMRLQINATDFSAGAGGTCTNLEAGHIHVNTTDGTRYNESYALTAAPTDSSTRMSAFTLAKNSTTVPSITAMIKPSVGNIYFGLGVPYGVAGNCQATIWFTALNA